MLRYLLPALVPSWRFFDVIGPSPRLEYALLARVDDMPEWLPFLPSPISLPVKTLLRRLLWNPVRNESLYVLSSSEKLVARDALQAREVLAGRIAQALQGRELPVPPWAIFFRYRIVLIAPEGDARHLVQQEVFVSEPIEIKTVWRKLP